MQQIFQNYETELKQELKELLSQDRDRDSEPLKLLTNGSEQKQPNEKELEEYSLYVMFCLQPSIRYNLKVFELNGSEKLSNIIFKSICDGSIFFLQ